MIEKLREQIKVAILGATDTNMTIDEAVAYVIDSIKEAGYVMLADDQIFPEMAEWGTEMHRIQKDYDEKMYDEDCRRVILEE